MGLDVGWGAVRWWRMGQGGSTREGLAACPGVEGSRSAGARVDPCQQCNYSSF